MVETQKRDVAYTTQDSSPTAALVFLLALLIVSLIGFIVYYFSNSNSALNNPTQIIERNINTETPVPVHQRRQSHPP